MTSVYILELLLDEGRECSLPFPALPSVKTWFVVTLLKAAAQ